MAFAPTSGPGTPIRAKLEARERARMQASGTQVDLSSRQAKDNLKGRPTPEVPQIPAPQAQPARTKPRDYSGILRAEFGQDSVTSGYRSQAEQDALVRRGVTRATRSSHTYDNGFDLAIGSAKSEDEIRQRMAARGIRVSKVIRETGRGKNQGTGPHWHIELEGDGSNQGNSNMASSTARGINVPDSKVQAPSGKMNTGVTSQSGRIMNSGPAMERAQQGVEKATTNAGDMLNRMIESIGESHASEAAAMATHVEGARAINNEMIAATQDLKKRVEPIFAARQRVLDQAVHVQSLSPLERAVRGIFDLNYNQKYLESTSARLGLIANEQAQMYSYMQGLHGDALEASERSMQINTMIPKLREEHATELAKGAEMQLQHADRILTNVTTGINNERNLLVAQATARADILSRIDAPTATNLLGQAEQNGGAVNFNGVQVSSQELRDKLQQNEQYETSLEMSRISLAAGRADLADKNAARLVDYMTDAQVENAIANGGVVDDGNGGTIQIPPALLTQTKNQRTAAAVQSAEANNIISTPTEAAAEAKRATLLTRQMQARANSIFGRGAIDQEMISVSTQITQLAERLTTAIQNNEGGAAIGVIRQQLQQAQANFQKDVQAKVTRLVGNDQEGAAYVTSYMLGDRPTPGAAADMMVHFAMRGGLPSAMQSSAIGTAGMEAVMRTISEVENEVKPGTSTRRFNDPAKVAREASRRIAGSNTPEGRAFRDATGGSVYQQTFSNLPSLARGQDGTPTHAFGRIDPSDFATAVRRSDQDGVAEIAAASGWDAGQMQAVLSGRDVPGLDPKVRAEMEKAGPRVGAAQQRALVARLDQMPRVSDQMPNSALMLDYLDSPSAQGSLMAADDQPLYGGLGDWMSSSVSKGFMLQEISRYRSGYASALGESQLDYRSQSTRLAKVYRNSPFQRTAAILGGMPDMTQGDITALVAAIGPLVPYGTPDQREGMRVGAMGDQGSAALGNSTTYRSDLAVKQIQAIDNIMLNHKFEDPALERIRKRASKDWLSASKAADNFLDNLTMHR